MGIAKLIILDECNCKFEGLDVSTRRKISDKLKFFLPYARHLPAVKLGRWDGSVTFCDIGGRTYVNLLDSLLPIVQSSGYDLQVEDRRVAYAFQFDPITEHSYSHVLWPTGHPLAGQPIVVKSHQVEAINVYLNNTSGVQVIATGAGKTIITAILSHKVEKYGRSVIIVPTTDLVTQTEEDYINFGLDVGVFYGGRKEYHKTHTICTWQSLDHLSKRSKDQDLDINIDDFFDGVVCVMVDECFAPDALVLTDKGYVPIKDISVGDTIVNYSESTGEYKNDTVVNVYRNLTKSSQEKMYALEFGNGEIVKVTGNHRFLTHRGWVRADVLIDTDDIISIADPGIRIINRTEIAKPEVVYTLEAARDHNYVVHDAVVENCHKSKAEALRKTLGGGAKHVPIRWGLTGTMPLEEQDKVAVISCVGPVIGGVGAAELQEKGILANLHINVMQLQDLGATAFGNYQTELKWLTSNKARLQFIADELVKIAQSGNTLVLVDRIETGETLQGMIPDSIFVSGKMKSKDRKTEYKEVQDVDGKILLASYGVAAVGINVNRIFNLVLLEAGKSFIRVIQSIGRGLRVAEDKDFVNVYDICSNSKYSRRHLSDRKKFYKEAGYEFTTKKIVY